MQLVVIQVSRRPRDLKLVWIDDIYTLFLSQNPHRQAAKLIVLALTPSAACAQAWPCVEGENTAFSNQYVTTGL